MTVASGDRDTVFIFNQVFCARTRGARIARGLSQADVARALGISRSAYARYKVDRPLPLWLIEDFVALTGADVYALFAIADEDDAAIPRSA